MHARQRHCPQIRLPVYTTTHYNRVPAPQRTGLNPKAAPQCSNKCGPLAKVQATGPHKWLLESAGSGLVDRKPVGRHARQNDSSDSEPSGAADAIVSEQQIIVLYWATASLSYDDLCAGALPMAEYRRQCAEVTSLELFMNCLHDMEIIEIGRAHV